jgi:hypothetical protein
LCQPLIRKKSLTNRSRQQAKCSLKSPTSDGFKASSQSGKRNTVSFVSKHQPSHRPPEFAAQQIGFSDSGQRFTEATSDGSHFGRKHGTFSFTIDHLWDVKLPTQS